MKDPAFLFYTKDFYEGTRTMIPEERACYIDLLCYQHQHGIIPDDIKRVTMYCSGCTEDLVNHVLNQKFNQVAGGWSNHRLDKEKTTRAEGKPKKVAAGTLAGLISSSNLDKKTVAIIKSRFDIQHFIYDDGSLIELDKLKEEIKKWFYNLVNHLVNNKANVNVIANAIVNQKENKGGTGGNSEGNDLWDGPVNDYPLHPVSAAGVEEKEILVTQWSKGNKGEFDQTIIIHTPPAVQRACKEMIAVINKLSGSNYPDKDKQYILDVLAHGYTLQECKDVIEDRWNKGKKNKHARQHYRPSTLFNIDKFTNYVNEIGTSRKKKNNYLEAAEKYNI